MLLYRITDAIGQHEEWADDPAGVDASVARRLGMSASDVESLRRRITVDPVVVRRDGARWRSRQVWHVRSSTSSARIYEMLRIDEAVYDH